MTSLKEESDHLFKELLKKPDVKHNKPRQQHRGPAPPARSWQQSKATMLPTVKPPLGMTTVGRF